MARYRTKDEADLIWNGIRRRITKEVDIVVQNERERILNDLLGPAFIEFSEALGEGKVEEVEGKYSRLVTEIVRDALPEKGITLERPKLD